MFSQGCEVHFEKLGLTDVVMEAVLCESKVASGQLVVVVIGDSHAPRLAKTFAASFGVDAATVFAMDAGEGICSNMPHAAG